MVIKELDNFLSQLFKLNQLVVNRSTFFWKAAEVSYQEWSAWCSNCSYQEWSARCSNCITFPINVTLII